jgi:hypothetical protein
MDASTTLWTGGGGVVEVEPESELEPPPHALSRDKAKKMMTVFIVIRMAETLSMS